MIKDKVPEKGRGGGKKNFGNEPPVVCSFCGRTSQEVNSMVAGPRAFICDRCILSSVEILRKEISAIRHTDKVAEPAFQP
ncbi:MAG: ATP-dependent Clp protease ATP-binding subunit ClpX, partial [Chlorobiaceae bacterium]|nr:ATP-dependent Clp protease ATP-binding subunit ClpX [Chlorobiaceae bacterium]